jgi:hypothetical protein
MNPFTLSRNLLLRGSNFLLYISFCLAAGTGLVLNYKLPPGSRGGKGLEMLGAGRHQWGEWHFWICLTFLGLIIIHLFLHRAWLAKVAGGRRLWPVAAGLLLGLGLILAPLALPVQKGGENHGNPTTQGRH